MQSDSSVNEESVVCISEFLERGRSEDRWGGPGHVRALLDNRVPPGPGDEEEERRTDQVIRR